MAAKCLKTNGAARLISISRYHARFQRGVFALGYPNVRRVMPGYVPSRRLLGRGQIAERPQHARWPRASIASLWGLRHTGVMFIIELSYKAELSEIDAHMRSHVAFLRKYYKAGNFLVSGRKIPRDGGIIVAMGQSREQVEAIVREDPFHKHGLADFRIIEFRASQRAEDFPERILE